MVPKPPTSKRSTGRVTLADVARVAGVSPITVSRAVSGRRSVAPELIERVSLIAKQLGYIPNSAARALASRHSSLIAILIPSLKSPVFAELVEVAQDVLRRAGFQTLIGVTHAELSDEGELLREHLAHSPAGLLVTGIERDISAQADIDASGVPCVHLFELTDSRAIHCVGFSPFEAGAAMTAYLLDRGYRRIAFAGAQPDSHMMLQMDGWRCEMKKFGCHDTTLEWLNPALSSQVLGAQMFAQIIQQSPQVEAIFFSSDSLAQGALSAANLRSIKVPGQIAIVGFGDLPGGELFLPPLTTIRTPRREVGEAAAVMLLRLIRGETVSSNSVDLGFSLVQRESA